MNPNQTSQIDQPARGKRGQTLAEFALTLPILLMLLFGVIEFARIFQAWITLQNSARTGARYAVTGRWDEEVVADVAGLTLPHPGTEDKTLRDKNREFVLDTMMPCTTGTDTAFQSRWGRDCEPGSDDDQGLRADFLRLPSIMTEARRGAAGLALADGMNYHSFSQPDGTAINDESVGEDESGWFHVWLCSSRRPFYDETLTSRYKPSEDRSNRVCEVQEGPNNGNNQYDAGGPGDAVEIVVFFNHPLITPLGLVDFVPLQARRVMINESFRSTRVVNLPPQLALPTFTPSNTPLPSNTPRPSDTPTITPTPSATWTPPPTDTSTPTPIPECNLITIESVRLTDNFLQIAVRNANAYGPVFINEAGITFPDNSSLYPSMYASEARIVGRSHFWRGQEFNSQAVINTSSSGWNMDIPTFFLRRFDPGKSTIFQMQFLNGPTRLADAFGLGDFNSSYLILSRAWGGIEDAGSASPCRLEIPDAATPTPQSETPTYTPTPQCEDYEVTFIDFEDNGVVHYSIRNSGTANAYITGFRINWNTYGRSLTPINLDFLSVGGTTAFDPVGVKMWDGNFTSPPAVADSGGSGWLIDPVILPGQTVDVWLDFDGTAGTLDEQLGYDESDFNNTRFEINFICNGGQDDYPTPVNTQPPTNTLTPSITPTPRPTNTPGPTHTPTPVTPTDTPRPVTDTPIPTATPTDPPTETPTEIKLET